jgi:hypothetical protein
MLNPRPVVQAALIEDGRYCLVVDDFLAEPQAVAHAVAQREAFRAAPVNCYPGIEQPLWAEFDQAMAAFFNAHIAPAFGAMQALGLNTRMSIVTLKPESCCRSSASATATRASAHRARARRRRCCICSRMSAWAAPALPAAPASAGNRPPAAPGAPHGQRRLQPRAGRTAAVLQRRRALF